VRCPSCVAELAVYNRFCPECGAAIGRDGDPATQTIAKTRAKPSTSSSSSEEGRFIAGTILANRYRVLGLVGRGGMGEVYRATDLKLNQLVALKFLPESTAHNPRLLERFHGEVRIARQVSHPNVCRVYDIAEMDGAAYISMEYVDGEDLGGLLRRIGRLPGDKAVEIARKLCAGLAAAHAKGVLHRDLKPSNIMIDGRGQVLIMDFGLAAIADQVEGAEVRNGTPAYMAPEQLAGREVTERSDIYALGLVLYEIFTGQRAFTTADRKATPSAVKDIDPAMERVIARCLEPDSTKRPQSALALARMLPGGDPLAEALAAGETPSPEMVAASGESEGLHPLVAWALLAGVIAAVTTVILLSAQTMLYRRVPLEKSPEVLAERARNILQSVGYSDPPADTAMGFYDGRDFLRYIAEHDKSKTRWDNLETGAFVFWYRSSPRPFEVRFNMFSSAFSSSAPVPGFVGPAVPTLDVSGMTLVSLNPLGRLTQFIAVPPLLEKPEDASLPDWAPLFSAAGLDPSKWPPAQPIWAPPVYGDSRAAWTGSLAERPNIPIRIEAAAFRGKPVYFELIGPWTHTERLSPNQPTTGARVSSLLGVVLLLSNLVGSAMLARRNLRLDRGDRHGASRLAAVVFATLAVNYLVAHHLPNFSEVELFLEFLSGGVAWSCFLWLLYIALEPSVRRHWPATLVSWSRLLAGGFRDPLVGRDVLVGCLLGACASLLGRLGWFVPSWPGGLSPQPQSGPQFQFLGARTIIANVSIGLGSALVVSLAFLFVLFLMRALLRNQWAAAAAFVLLLSGLLAAQVQEGAFGAFAALVALNGVTVFLLIRLGLLALVACFVFQYCLLENFPLTTQGSAWYAGISLAGIVLMAAMALYGFYTSLGGRPVFGGAVFEE
jgi:serine/threonine protein kinase